MNYRVKKLMISVSNSVLDAVETLYIFLPLKYYDYNWAITDHILGAYESARIHIRTKISHSNGKLNSHSRIEYWEFLHFKIDLNWSIIRRKKR